MNESKRKLEEVLKSDGWEIRKKNGNLWVIFDGFQFAEIKVRAYRDGTQASYDILRIVSKRVLNM